jgi:RNA polymerase sigma factor (sigma-70 family)
MSCNPPQLAEASEPDVARERVRVRALDVLRQIGAPLIASGEADPALRDAGLATSLMDAFRRTGNRDAFECLAQWAGPQLHARIRSRLRGLGTVLDANEVLQDTLVNVYRYPDRFLASRPGAFAAWSTTIVDNAIRRHLRRQRQGIEITLRAPEMLQEHADGAMREPSAVAQDREECSATAHAFGLVLQCYLAAFRALREREQFVLQMVEVRGLRYAELGALLGIRPEAVKMIVFRARKRVFDRTAALLGQVAPRPSERAEPRLLATA